jgi:hypothetical protein
VSLPLKGIGYLSVERDVGTLVASSAGVNVFVSAEPWLLGGSFVRLVLSIHNQEGMIKYNSLLDLVG